MEYAQYAEFIKPSWAPPAYLFGPVWSVLYLIIIISFGYVFWLAWKKKIPSHITTPFLLNLITNLIFTPIQFALRNNPLAAADIVLVLITLVWSMIVIYKYKKWVTYAQIPYLLWVSFATILQFTITYLNF